MKSVTLGAANSGPLIGPVAISEVMYSTPGNNPDLQFVELTNVTSQAVALSNTFTGVGAQPWTISGLGFTFPLGTMLAPRASMVIVDFDPTLPANSAKLATFRSTYGIGSSVQIVGGWTGTLDHPSDDLTLLRPDAPPSDNPTLVPYVLVDEVNYTSAAPWTSTANQQNGNSLTRNLTSIYGIDPTNWIGAPATPGTSDLAAANLAHGDFSFDGQAGPADVSAMLAALGDVPGFEAAHGLTDADWRFLGDMNGDHVVNNLDLQGLLTLLITSSGGGAVGGGSDTTSTSNGSSGAGSLLLSAATSTSPVYGSGTLTINPGVLSISVSAAAAPAIEIVPGTFTSVPDSHAAAFIAPHHWTVANPPAPTPVSNRFSSAAVDQILNVPTSGSLHLRHDRGDTSADQLDDLFAAWK
jgi:hypothetical protein